ncbi:MAG: hypothetical protein QXI84_04425 [Thermofilaceae archaeon]
MKLRTLPVLALAALLPALVAAQTLTVKATVSYEFEAGVATAVVKVIIVGAANTTYGVEVRGPGGEVVALKEAYTDGSGLATLTLELPDVYPAGSYTVYVSGGGENATATFEIRWEKPAEEAAPTGPVPSVAAQNLVRVASRLSSLVHCRNEILAAANVTQTEYASLYQQVLNLTSVGDKYLALANESLNNADYSAAFRYAHAAIQSYGAALELQEFIKDQLDISFAACRFVLAPVEPPVPKGPEANRTCKWTPEFYPLMTALDVAERRIEELEKLVARAAENGYNVSEIAQLLERAKSLVEEGRKLAQACNESEAAHRLAEAKKLLGLANAALARLGTQRLVRDMARRGVEVNETDIESIGRALRSGKAVEKIAELVNRTLSRVRERVEKQIRLEKEEMEKLEKRLQKLEEIINKLTERQVPQQARETVEKAREIAQKVREEATKRAGGRGK